MPCKLRNQSAIVTKYIELLKKCHRGAATERERGAFSAIEWCLQMNEKMELGPCYSQEGERHGKEVWDKIRKLKKAQSSLHNDHKEDKLYSAGLQLAIDIMLWKLGILLEVDVPFFKNGAQQFIQMSVDDNDLFRNLDELQKYWNFSKATYSQGNNQEIMEQLEDFDLLFSSVFDWFKRKYNRITIKSTDKLRLF